MTVIIENSKNNKITFSPEPLGILAENLNGTICGTPVKQKCTAEVGNSDLLSVTNLILHDCEYF